MWRLVIPEVDQRAGEGVICVILTCCCKKLGNMGMCGAGSVVQGRTAWPERLGSSVWASCHPCWPPRLLQHIALQINEEADLHNRLLEDLDEDVDVTSSRLKAAQRRLKIVMRKAGSCKTQLLIFLLLVILVVVIIIGFKIAIHF